MDTANLITQLSDQLAALVGEAGPRVVQVSSRHARPATGTVFAPERVLTAAHALERHNGTLAVKDGSGTSRSAELVGTDVSSNLAVLRVPGLDVKPLEPAGEARPGELTVALGRTWSGALGATAGVASVIGGPLRTGRGPALEQVLRADVRVHPLGAGGPLIDAGGRVVAIATGAVMRGLPLFIPASIAWRVAETIGAHGSVKRGYLGVSAQPVRLATSQRAGRAQEAGLLVVGVAEASPAEQAAVLVGDIIVGLDRQPVEDHDALLSLLSGERVGKSVGLELIRGGEPKTLSVTVAERKA